MNGVKNIASGTAYTTSHKANVVIPNPIAGPEQVNENKHINIPIVSKYWKVSIGIPTINSSNKQLGKVD